MISICKLRTGIFLFTLLVSLGQGIADPRHPAITASDPKIVGAMKDVMWEGRLSAQFDLDTLADKSHLYGLGPVEFLSGEILILDGKAYVSEVRNDTSMQVTETLKVKAPFFGFANIGKWIETHLPDSVATLPELEAYLDKATKTRKRPFFFRITAVVDSSDVHVVNLPKGAKVSSPSDAHLGQMEFPIRGEKIELLGFFPPNIKPSSPIMTPLSMRI